jgi:tRNA(Ile)-lysidine synthase
MIQKVIKTIEKYNLLERGERVVVAHSGGPDSTALLAVLAFIASQLNLTLITAHFNHRLRGAESDEDEEFSRNLSGRLGVVFCSEKMDQEKDRKGIAPEDYYRQQRYNFLDKVAANYRAQKIALGHHMQDQAETVLLNLLRGSGLDGLKGILPKRDGKIIRPLIEISRQEILSYLNTSGIAYRQDSSNENRIYLRNQIRMELIPFLKEKYNPNIEHTFARTAEILRTEDEFIGQHVKEALESPFIQKGADRILLKIDFINKLPQALRWRLFKTVLEDFSPSKNGFSFIHIKSLDDLSQKCESGKRIILPLGIEARCEYENLILENRTRRTIEIKYEYGVSIPGNIHVRERNVNVRFELAENENIDFSNRNKVYLDLDKIKQPLILRNRRDGDWFQPLGMKGRQKLKNFFIDHKIPGGRRDEMMLLADSISVIFIENLHFNDRVKITPETKKVLTMEIINP